LGVILENQHKQIKGYRDLSQVEINLMNKIKEQAVIVGNLVEEMEAVAGIDARWAEIAKTDLQTGFMALVRAVAKPTTF
jgi:hypothetical protein